jgi:hypothetical protein
MGIGQREIGSNGAKIYCDDTRPWRVYGGYGEGLREWHLYPGLPCDDTTNSPTEWIATQTGTSPTTVGVVQGYPLLITTAATEYNGANLQLRGSQAKFAALKEFRLRGKIKLSDATQSDFLFGACQLKTDLLNTSSSHAVNSAVEGAFFVKLDGGTSILFKVVVAGTEKTSVSVGTMTTSDIDYAIWWDGTFIHAYLNDVEVAKVGSDLPTVVCTPSINLRAGEAGAKTASFAELAFVSVE